jgi:steroid 5-alpha reductase family enzyme
MVISGVPMLEKKADKRWGGQEDYENYKKNTPVLIPRPPAKK